MQYHELRVTFEFEEVANITGIDAASTLDATLWCDYVYLDQDERKKFAAQPHEYLIEQVQFTGDENVTVASTSRAQQIRLSFNHPTKLLAWVVASGTASDYGKFTGGAAGTIKEALAPIASAKLMLNGHDRADLRVGAYYNKVVPYQANKANPDAGIYFMSFALSPTQHAPSGSLNLSRIDSAVLALTFKAASAAGSATNIANVTTENITITGATNLSALRVFAVNYNVLRIMSGMGGLALNFTLKNRAEKHRATFNWAMNVENPLRSPEYDQMLVEFVKILQDSLLFGNTLRALHTKVAIRKTQLAERKNSGMVKVAGIGQSAGEFLNPLMQGHGTVSETERLSVSATKSLARSRMLEIQSIPLGKLRGIEIPTNLHNFNFNNTQISFYDQFNGSP